MLFKDITPLLADGAALRAVVSGWPPAVPRGEPGGVDKVAGIEARGFILAAPVALALGAGFVPVRKQGKLPGPTYAQSYDLEYGSATIEVHQDAFAPGRAGAHRGRRAGHRRHRGRHRGTGPQGRR